MAPVVKFLNSPSSGPPCPALRLFGSLAFGHLYAASGLDLHAQQERVTQLLAEFNLRTLDLGVKNLDEDGRELVNQCFYLSIARSYLGHVPGFEEVQKVA